MRTLGLPWTKAEANTKHSRQDTKFDQTINGTSISKRGQLKRSSDNLEEADGETPKRRKPGRPKKSLQAEEDDESTQANQSGSRHSAGHNQFAAVNGGKEGASQVAGKKGRSRVKQEIDPDDKAWGLAGLTQIARRRPGRPRKTL